MSARASVVLSVVAAAVLSGCVTVPSGPAVTVLPGSRKTFEAFQSDDVACRNYAQSVIGGPAAGQAASDAATANAVAGAALGAAAGAIIGSVSGQAGQGAAIGAGTGLLFGGMASSDAAGYSSYALQRNYDSAYVQCMYARGNFVPSVGGYRGGAEPRYYGVPSTSNAPSGARATEPSATMYPPPPGAASGNYPPPGYPPPPGASPAR